MTEQSYFQWLSNDTDTKWWNDSGITADIKNGLIQGAVGVTTNPVLIYNALVENKNIWRNEITAIAQNDQVRQKAVDFTGLVVKKASELLMPVYISTNGDSGYVCSQVNPAAAWDRESMYATAKKMCLFNENISVKLPATAAGLDVMEDCIVEGINITMTVSFTVPQVLAIAERVCKAEKIAKKKGNIPGKCFAVIMIGRIDDYIREIAADTNTSINEADIINAGLAITKRAYEIYKKENYSTTMMIAAMRGVYHITDLAGADLILSIHPNYQKPLFQSPPAKELLIDRPVKQSSIDNLLKLNEFRKAYEPDGMKPEEFLSFGAEQRTLTQFSEVGWKMLEGFTI